MLCSFRLWIGGKIFGGYVFTGLVRQPAAGAFGDRFFLFYVFTELVLFGTSGPFGDTIFSFCVFTELVLFGTSGPFGDPLSGLPERGERATKGLQSRPLETCFDTGERRGDVRTFLRIRIGAIDAIKSASALRLSPRLCVLLQLRRKRWHLENNQRFANFAVGWLRKCSDLPRQRSRHEGAGISASAAPG